MFVESEVLCGQKKLCDLLYPATTHQTEFTALQVTTFHSLKRYISGSESTEVTTFSRSLIKHKKGEAFRDC